MSKVKLATVWLDGCSGCHMSVLDMDEALIDLARRIEIVYGPLVDAQEFPKSVDVTLVEGAVSTRRISRRCIRSGRRAGSWSRSATARPRGTCRRCGTPIPVKQVLERVYQRNVDAGERRSPPMVCRRCCAMPFPLVGW